MAFEFGMFHEFQRTAGVTDEEAFATSFEEIDAAERWGLDAMWLAEIHVNPERSVCSAPLTLASAIAARTNAHEGRHRRSGPAALPSAAAGRRGRDGRSDQPRPADLRHRTQRLSAHLRSLWRALRREPRALCRDARNPEAGVDRAVLLLSRQVLQLRQRQAVAEALSEAVARHPHRRQQRRHVPAASPSSGMACSSRCARARSKSWNRTSPPTARPGRRRAIPARARSSCARRSMSPTPTRRRARSRKRASCISTAISASGSRIRQPARGCSKATCARRAAGGCRPSPTTEALREKLIVGSPERVADRLMGLQETLGLDGILCEMNCGTKIPHAQVMRSLQLLCEKVKAQFQ